MSEDVEVMIRKYESKIAELERKLKVTKEQMKEIAKLYPGKTEAEISKIDPWYRGFYYSKLAFLRWIGEYRKKLEELMKKLVAVEFRMTFSIETGTSHGKAVLTVAEVTASTVHRKFDEIKYRMLNVCLKLFWILFDAFKDLTKDKRVLIGEKIYDNLLKRVIYVQEGAEMVYEEFLDRIINDMMRYMGSFKRPSEEYFTHKSIIKIGVEKLAPSEKAPKYPDVEIFIEKTVPTYYSKKCIVKVSDVTYIDILGLLGIEVEW